MTEVGGSLLLQSNSRSSEELITMLEKRVVVLVERYQDAKKTMEELQIRVSEGEAQCAELTTELAALTGDLVARDQLHLELRQRLDHLLEQLDKLETTGPDDPRSVGGVATA